MFVQMALTALALTGRRPAVAMATREQPGIPKPSSRASFQSGIWFLWEQELVVFSPKLLGYREVRGTHLLLEDGGKTGNGLAFLILQKTNLIFILFLHHHSFIYYLESTVC